MSRVGKVPILIPDGVNVALDGLNVRVSGPKGEISKLFSGEVDVCINDRQISVQPLSQTKQARAMWGTVRSIINGMVFGVKHAFSQELEVNGVGYRAMVKGSYLNLVLGKSHATRIEIPSNIKVDTPKQNVILLESIDKQALGQFIALVMQQRPPEPYKGKGIKPKGRYVQRKEGKKK